MVWKIALAAATAFMGANAVTTNYQSTVDPLNIVLPDIPQTTSLDSGVQCTYYNSPNAIVPSEWPTVWGPATSNGMNTSAEFTALYNSIDWTKAPNFPVRKLNAAGGLDMTGYDGATDPACWWSASTCKTPKTAGINADLYACPEPDVWGITFDDGPNCSHNAFYDYLEKEKQKATMFYIGSNVVNWPYGALRGVKDGHHIAGHTWSHKMMTTLTNQEVLAELYYTQKAIKHVTGVTPKHWRPALGDLDDRVRWIATQLDLTAILWTLDTFDWAANVTPGITEQTVDDNYEAYIKMGTNGSYANSGNIVLSHEINDMTMQFFMKHYPDIKKAYSHVMDVATCMNITQPYVESAVTFPTFDQAVGSTTNTSTGASSASGATTPGAAKASTSPAASAAASVYTSLNGPLFIAALFGLLVLV
ncbi:chitin deacetylase 1 [Mucor mucedo]|uniref:chitin deacetylase 1 n=1 Tax=Mucor mucedo TaxID=29922 RepID=UPI00221EEFCC|nr:chitin deacetylase 1 [Mucor mucedo]KAI7893220.1 chitin deacetylase 1 [Mucor mucedo]